MANIALGEAEYYSRIEAECQVLYFTYCTWQSNDLSVIKKFLNIHSEPLNILRKFSDFDDELWEALCSQRSVR